MTRHSEATFTQQNRTKMKFLKKTLLLRHHLYNAMCKHKNSKTFSTAKILRDGRVKPDSGAFKTRTVDRRQREPGKPNTFLVWDGGTLPILNLSAKCAFAEIILACNTGEATDPVKFALKGYQALPETRILWNDLQ